MTIEKLEEFAVNGDKHLTGLDVATGFPRADKPERPWFNKLFGDITKKTNELINYRNSDEETKLIASSGFTIIDSFELGATLTQRNEALRHAADGRIYRWAGDLPKVVPVGSTPTSSGGIGTNAWLEVSDTSLRQEIVNNGLVTDNLVLTTQGVNQKTLNDAASAYVNLKTTNTWQQNRDALQAVNDALYLSKKGGKIQLPSGEYEIKGVVLDGGIEVFGNNTMLNHPDGFDGDIFNTRTFSTTTNTTKGSYTITVPDASNIKVGCLVGIEAAGGLNIYQSTRATMGIDASQTTGIILTDRTGFNDFSVGHGNLAIDDELISYTSISATNELGGVKRGVLGTTPTSHFSTSNIGIALRHVSEVVSVVGNTVTLLKPVLFTTTNADVKIGTIKTKVSGVSYNGLRQNNASGFRLAGIRATLHRLGSFESYAEDIECSIYLQTSSDNYIRAIARNVGKTGTNKFGAGVWVYQGSNNNEIHATITGDSWCGVVIDDRSNIATEWEAPCNNNFGSVVGNLSNFNPSLVTTLLNIVGCSGNEFTLKGEGFYTPIFIDNNRQGTTAVGAIRLAEDNDIKINVGLCVNAASALNCKNNIFSISARKAQNAKAGIGEGNLITYASYSSVNGASLKLQNGSYIAPSYSFIDGTTSGMSRLPTGVIAFYHDGIPMLTYNDKEITLRDGKGVNTGSGLGTSFGTAPTQKLSFYGATPVVRPTVAAAATDAATTQALVNDLRDKLKTIGIIG